MKKNMIFSGVSTALITPFKEGRIDFEGLEKIIDAQINAGIKSLTVAGTTGESSTLSDEERFSLYRFAKEKTRGKIALILGTGTNDTERTLFYTEEAERIGAEGALIVTPYYNKGTEEGIFRHYERIATSCRIPQIIYNVPSRTGVSISIENLTRLKGFDSIAGIKEASGNLTRLMAISDFGDELPLYSGNDTDTYVTLSLGGAGVISVASNVCPEEMLSITESFSRGDITSSLAAQRRLMPLINALFLETNPAPVKYAMQLLGYCNAETRLPLTEPSEETKKKINKELCRLSFI